MLGSNFLIKSALFKSSVKPLCWETFRQKGHLRINIGYWSWWSISYFNLETEKYFLRGKHLNEIITSKHVRQMVCKQGRHFGILRSSSYSFIQTQHVKNSSSTVPIFTVAITLFISLLKLETWINCYRANKRHSRPV